MNKIILGDALEEIKKIPSNSIDMMLCDLPYGTTKNKWDSIIPLEEMWKEINRVVKINGAIVLTSQGIFTAKLIMSNELDFRYKWVWHKSKATNFLNAKRQPLRKHEDICVFYKKPPVYNPQFTEGEPYSRGVRKNSASASYSDFREGGEVKNETGDRFPTDVLYFKTAESEGKVIHPTQKPIELGRYLIRTYSNPGDVVLDICFGSASFLISSYLEDRRFVGIEKSEEYFDLSLGRMKEFGISNFEIIK